MDLRCERCRAQYVVNDDRVPEVGVAVACARCGHVFRVKRKALVVTVPLRAGEVVEAIPVTALSEPRPAGEGPLPGERREAGWMLRQGASVFALKELTTLQRWIVERKASRDDQVSPGGDAEAWRRLGDIPELRSFFSLVEKASRGGEPQPGPPPAEPRLTRGTEDPAWANDAASPPRRVTRPQAPAPRPKRRVVWVALLALGLLGVAAGTVYLRRKAEADAVAQAIAPPPAPVVVAATPKPAEVKPVEPARDPEPAKAPAAGPVPEKAEAPPPVEAPLAEAQPAPKEADPAPKEAVRAPPRDEASTALRTALAQAREQRDRGRCEAALDLYGRALAIDGRNAAALAGRGACYLDLSRYAQAEASFEEALESDPRSAEALFGLAETYRYMGRNADAVAGYERFLSVRPTGDDAAAARRLISQLKE